MAKAATPGNGLDRHVICQAGGLAGAHVSRDKRAGLSPGSRVCDARGIRSVQKRVASANRALTRFPWRMPLGHEQKVGTQSFFGVGVAQQRGCGNAAGFEERRCQSRKPAGNQKPADFSNRSRTHGAPRDVA